jgi:hypothetical protein
MIKHYLPDGQPMKIFLTVITGFLIFAQSPECSLLETKDNDKELSVWAGVVTAAFVIPAGVIMINNHEIGHTVFARISGDKDAHYSLIKREAFFDYTKLSRYENAIVPLGGILFSELLAEGSDLLNRNVAMPEWMHRLLSVTYFIAKADILMQTEQLWENSHFYNKMKKSGAPCGSDFVDFSFYISNGNRSGFNCLRIGLTSIGILDMAFSWNKIKRNWQIATGKKVFIPK